MGSAAPLGPLQPQASGGPIRVPPLAAEQANRYAALFEESGAQDGLLPGTFGSTLGKVLMLTVWL